MLFSEKIRIIRNTFTSYTVGRLQVDARASALNVICGKNANSSECGHKWTEPWVTLYHVYTQSLRGYFRVRRNVQKIRFLVDKNVVCGSFIQAIGIT